MGRFVHGALAAVVAAMSWPTHGVAAPGDELFIVDCMLPGEIRRLGQNRVYASPRRPARISGRECSIRGGEYVEYDRANLRSSLDVWLAEAKTGDVTAMEYVGEIFEKGPGGQPDYAAAAEWYRKAAAEGSTRAQINLGHLYEKGLGVARDSLEAAKWYRTAAGVEGAIALDPGPDPQLAAKNEALKSQLTDLQNAAAGLRDELIRAQESAGIYAVTPPETVPEAPVETGASPEEVAKLNADIESLETELNRVRGELAESQQAKTADRERLQTEIERTEQGSRELEEKIAAANDKLAELAAAEARLVDGERELDKQKAALEALVQAANESKADPAALRERVIAGPVISMIDPQLSNVRGAVAVPLANAVQNRPIVGRVEAPAGLLQLTVNDASVAANPAGVFQYEVEVSARATPVRIVATDNQGKQAEYQFTLNRDATAPGNEALPTSYTQIEFGNYHALVIGNNKYAHYKDLATAVNDANRIDGILRERYGFQTTLLTDANRYQILSALNEYREKLSPEDNLLIYYAGHGELDEVNQRGHWIPTDGEPENTANWISNIAITDILNTMRARHVMLVVDSCYAGAMTRSATSRLKTGMTEQEEAHWLRAMMQKRARMALTSGGVAPVLDGGGGEHSVFAKSFIEVLESNQNLLDGQRLYRDLAARVAFAAANLQFKQEPEYAPIRFAGHEAGDFFLLPARIPSASQSSIGNGPDRRGRIDFRNRRTASTRLAVLREGLR